jgi:dihydroorotase
MGDLVRRLSLHPSRLLHHDGGTLRLGAAADITILDPAVTWVVDPDRMHSKARNSAFIGMTLKGQVRFTLVDGEIRYDSRRFYDIS